MREAVAALGEGLRHGPDRRINAAGQW
jgi:hypothetical protein